jgi:peptide/nickel transport system permease protein
VGAYFLRRILIAIPVLFGITIAGFLVLMSAPGDPITARLAPEVLARMTPADLAAARHALGLDQPLPIQYLDWLGGVLQGNLGYSFLDSRAVAETVGNRIGPTLLLMGSSLVLAVGFGIPLGVISAVNQYSKVDYGLSAVTVILIATPTFVFGLLGLDIFGVDLKVLPVGEMVTFGKEGDLVDRLAHLAMPAVILGASSAAPLLRYTRASMLDVLGSEYMTTARSKGLAGQTVVVRHGLRNALIPIITLVGILLPDLIGGAVITETVFDWPGMGQLAVQAASNRDPPLMMAIVLIVGASVLASSIIADFAYAVADPRVRYVRGR